MLCRTACNLHLSQVDPHNTVAIDAVHVPLPIYRSTCSRCLPEWLNIGKVKAICSDVEQPRLVLNEHGQLCSEFVYCVIEVVMQMVVGVNLVVSQFVQQQRVVLKGTRRVVVEEVYHHDAPLTHEPFFRLIPTQFPRKPRPKQPSIWLSLSLMKCTITGLSISFGLITAISFA